MHHASVRVACQHLLLFQGIYADAILSRWAEIARGEQIRLAPHPVLGVVREELSRGERVPEIGAGGVPGLRDRDAVVEDGPAGSELSQKPAILERSEARRGGEG